MSNNRKGIRRMRRKRNVFGIYFCILSFMLCGCSFNKQSNHIDGREPITSTEPSQELENGQEVSSTETLGEDVSHKQDAYSDYGIIDENLQDVIDENVVLTKDTMIASYEWVDEDKNCLRIRVQYKDNQLGSIQKHKEDYFIFINEVNTVEQVLHVEYDDKEIGYACDYTAYFEDVTFDGKKDLLIWLGDGRYAGYYCAYVYEDGQYRYEKTFESIPDYEVDEEEHVIHGWNGVSANEETEYVYEYKNGTFVLIYEDTHAR